MKHPILVAVLAAAPVLAGGAFLITRILAMGPEPVSVTETSSSTVDLPQPNVGPPAGVLPEGRSVVTLKETVIVAPRPQRSGSFARDARPVERLAWTCSGWTESKVGGAYRTCEFE